jgi:hypothetical protein
MLSIEDGVLICAARALEELRQRASLLEENGKGGRSRSPIVPVNILSFPLGDPNLERSPLSLH